MSDEMKLLSKADFMVSPTRLQGYRATRLQGSLIPKTSGYLSSVEDMSMS